jgi:hypothetical protein
MSYSFPSSRGSICRAVVLKIGMTNMGINLYNKLMEVEKNETF